MGHRIEIETTVCGGFPVLAFGYLERPDHSVGWQGGICDISVKLRNGKPASFIQAKMTDRDWDNLAVELREAEGPDDADYWGDY